MSKLSTYVLLFLSLLMILFTVAGRHGLVELGRMNQEIESLRGKNKELTKEASDLINHISSIQESEFALEKKAREELGLAKPGEKVYIFPENPK